MPPTPKASREPLPAKVATKARAAAVRLRALRLRLLGYEAGVWEVSGFM